MAKTKNISLKSFSFVAIFIFVFLQLAIGSFAKSSPRFSIHPEGKQLMEGRLVYQDVEPGSSVDGGVAMIQLIDNNVDASFKMGKFVELNSSGEDPSNWLSFLKNEIEFTIEGGKEERIPLRITVPEGTLPGDYVINVSVTMTGYAEKGSKPRESSGDKEKDSKIGIGAKINMASAMSITVRVKGLIEIDAKLKDFDGSLDGNTMKFNLNYVNNSNVSIIPIAAIIVEDAITGKEIANYTKDLPILLAKSESKQDVFLEKIGEGGKENRITLPQGIFKTKIDLNYVIQDYFISRKERTIYNAGSAEIELYNLPLKWFFYGIITIFALIIAITYKIYRKKKLLSISKEYTVKNSDTVQSLSVTFNLNPETIVSVNKLKYPFILMPGTKIYIPRKK